MPSRDAPPWQLPDFVYTPLGPRSTEDGDVCCGLWCGRPCPYGLRLLPGTRTAPAKTPAKNEQQQDEQEKLHGY
jgi:hypothetical protein